MGWVTYFRHAQCRSTLWELDDWLRHKLRCARLKHCKSPSTTADFLCKQGVADRLARQVASPGKGWGRLANTEQAKRAMPNDWFDALGGVGLANDHAALNRVGNRRGE